MNKTHFLYIFLCFCFTLTSSLMLLKMKNKKISTIIVFLSILILVFSLLIINSEKFPDIVRYNIHFSHPNGYKRFYTNLDTFINPYVEVGFLSFSYLMHILTAKSIHFYVVLLLIYYFFVFFYFKKIDTTIKNYIYIVMIPLIFIIGGGIFYNMYLLKQIIAISLINLSLVLLYDHKDKSALILATFSVLFHKIAVIPIFILFCFVLIKNKKIKFKLILVIYMILTALGILGTFITFKEVNISFFKYASFNIILLSYFRYLDLDSYIEGRDLYFLYFFLMNLLFNNLTLSYYWSHRVAWFFLLPTSYFIAETIMDMIELKCKNTSIKRQLYLFCFALFFQFILHSRQVYISTL